MSSFVEHSLKIVPRNRIKEAKISFDRYVSGALDFVRILKEIFRFL